jgi:hypothetical protein
MTSMRARRAALTIVMLTALTGAAACSSSDSPEEPGKRDDKPTAATLAALRSAERSTDRAGSAQVHSRAVMGTRLSIRADGSLDWGDGLTGALTITYTGGTAAETMRRLGTTSMQARYLPDAYYARMGDRFAEQAGGRHWIRYAYDDLETLAGGSGADFADQMRSTAPQQSVELLLASGDVRKVGRETVGGQRTTHYSGTVEVADVADAGLKKRLSHAGVTTQTVDIWVDDRNLLVKKVEQAATSSGAMTQTATYGQYGVQVTAERPPAADTEDFTDLMKNRVAGTS